MSRLIIGIVIGWLTARWYYQTESIGSREAAGPQGRDLRDRARAVADEVGEVAQELAEEGKAAARIEGNNLEDKAQRVRKAAAG